LINDHHFWYDGKLSSIYMCIKSVATSYFATEHMRQDKTMNSHNFAALQAHIDENSTVSERVIAALAQEMLDAATGSAKNNLQALDEQLAEKVRLLVAKVPNEVFEQSEFSPEAAKNYSSVRTLGMLELAHTIIARANGSLVDEEFIQLCKQDQLVGILSTRSSSNIELAKLSGLQPETVSRTLKRLTQLGITDYRQKGRVRINFLTPAAKQICMKVHEETYESAKPREVLAYLNQYKSAAAKNMLEKPSFAPQQVSPAHA
jgi:DNA-binding transcriptional ArsR family regulator